MYRIILVAVALNVLSNHSVYATSNDEYLHLVEQARTEYGIGAYGSAGRLFLAALKSLDNDDYRHAETLLELGSVYANEDQLSKAEQVYGQSLTMYRKLGDAKSIAIGLRHLGALYCLESRFDEALRALHEALGYAKADHDRTLQADVFNIIGTVYYRQDKQAKAARWFSEALQIDSIDGLPADLQSQLLNNLGNVYQAQRKNAEAETLLKGALNQIERARGSSHPDLISTLVSLAHLYTETGRYTDAEDRYRQALNILASNESEFETRIARVLHALAAMYARAGRKAEADTALERAAAIARRTLSQHSDMATILEEYSLSLKNHGRSKEASELLAEVRRARMASSLVVTPLPF